MWDVKATTSAVAFDTSSIGAGTNRKEWPLAVAMSDSRRARKVLEAPAAHTMATVSIVTPFERVPLWHVGTVDTSDFGIHLFPHPRKARAPSEIVGTVSLR